MSAERKPVSGLDVAQIRAQFPILSREVNGKPLVYLDSAASAQKPEAVIEPVADVWRHSYANVHRGLHTLANEATEAFETSRGKMARFLGADTSDQIVFTRGATEAINLVADSFGATLGEGDEIILSQMEHHSNIVPWHFLRERKGVVLKWAPVTDDGALDMDSFDALVTERTKLVAITHMSNVMGTISPIEAIVSKAHAVGAAVLVDGSQGAVHMPVDVKALGGGEMIAEVREDGVVYADVPHKFEAGTPVIAEVIGLGAALDWMCGLDRIALMEHERQLMDRFEAGLAEFEGATIYGRTQDKGAITSFGLEGAHPHDLAQLMDKYGVAVRAGHHCAHPLMQRFGVPGTLRASFAAYNTEADVDAALEALRKAKSFLI